MNETLKARISAAADYVQARQDQGRLHTVLGILDAADGAVDYEAAAEILHDHPCTMDDCQATTTSVWRDLAHRVVDAALGRTSDE